MGTQADSRIMHVVLFKWKAGATPEQIDRVVEGLRGLKDEIPGILELSCGPDFCGRSQGFALALVVQFTDRAALDAYAVHPAHQHIIHTDIDPIRGEVLAFDYEM